MRERFDSMVVEPHDKTVPVQDQRQILHAPDETFSKLLSIVSEIPCGQGRQGHLSRLENRTKAAVEVNKAAFEEILTSE